MGEQGGPTQGGDGPQLPSCAGLCHSPVPAAPGLRRGLLHEPQRGFAFQGNNPGRRPHFPTRKHGMDDFTGCWVLDKSISDSADPLLKAFGVSYLLRGVILRLHTVTTFRYDGDKFSVVQTTSGKDKVDEFVLDGMERTVKGEDGVMSRVTASTDGVRIKVRTVVPKLSLTLVSERSLGEDSNHLNEHVLIQREDKPEERLHFILRRDAKEEASRGIQEAVAEAVARHQRLRAAAEAESAKPEPTQQAAGPDSREDGASGSDAAPHSRDRSRRHRRHRTERSRRHRSDRRRRRKRRSPSETPGPAPPQQQSAAPQRAGTRGSEGESLWAPAVDAFSAALRWVRDEPPQLLAALVVSGLAGSLYGPSAVAALVLALAAAAHLLDGAPRGRRPGTGSQPGRAQGTALASEDAAGDGRGRRGGTAWGDGSASGSDDGSSHSSRSDGSSCSSEEEEEEEEGDPYGKSAGGHLLPLHAAADLPRVRGAGADCNLRYCPHRGALIDAGPVSCLDITAFLKIPPAGPPLAAPYSVPGEGVRPTAAAVGARRRRRSREDAAQGPAGGVAGAAPNGVAAEAEAAAPPTPDSLTSLWEVVDGSTVGGAGDGSTFGGDDGGATVLTSRAERRVHAPLPAPTTPRASSAGAAQPHDAPAWDGAGRVAPPLCLPVRGLPHVFFCDAGGDVHVVWPGATPSAAGGTAETGLDVAGNGGRAGARSAHPLPPWSRGGWCHRLLRGEMPSLPRCVDGVLSGVVGGGRPHVFFRTPGGSVREVVFMGAAWHSFDLHAAAARQTPQPPLAGALGEAFWLGIYFRDVEERPFTLSYSLLRGWRCGPVDERGEAQRAANSPRADVVVGKLPRGRRV